MANPSDFLSSVQNDHGLLAKPLHLQRLEKAVRLDPFLDYVENYFKNADETLADNGECSQSNAYLDPEILKEAYKAGQETDCDSSRLYNFSKVKKSRKWLKNILLSSDSSVETGDSSGSDDSSIVTEEDLQDMLRLQKQKKSAHSEFQVNPELKQYQYYSTGLLSNSDKFYEHQKAVLGSKKKLKEKSPEKRKGKLKKVKVEGEKCKDQLGSGKKRGSRSGSPHNRHSKKKNGASHEAVMTMKRRRIWVALSKKEIGRAVKQNLSTRKEVLTSAKRLAQACQREVRKSALLSQKVMKDVPSRARRLTKEMLLYWKRYEKVEKEHRKKAEKEAQEQMRMDIELREAKRQQRKLNFLITQTELYAHFMSRKRPGLEDMQEKQILSQLDEKKDENVSSVILSCDDYDHEEMKALALKNADEAYKSHVSQTSVFDCSLPSEVKKKHIDSMEAFDGNLRLSNPTINADEKHPQPAMFVGLLKSYQLKGMNWLYSLYDKGINGILADEMGLGKTVQTIAFLATLIKAQGIWGPFLIIAPASTLHNWQQEFTKFVPKFKVLPYWGNTSDRKVLRKFWSQKDLHTEQASFHVLITSYQLVVQDVKYFQRIKWQYMVLDEAQAIKSTSSVRWKILLGFNCRNRLLLTGTPIQNSMAELWALLHFIMPTLFDSHDEFNEWFSKDIESHAENKTAIDEKHLSRLHKILQPFMLRRVKKDVENELSDKIEIMMHCQLRQRQKVLYQNLRNKISIDDLMQSSSTSSSSSLQSQNVTSSLLNLVMQFRKVCNHPDLFERREVKHPFHMKLDTYFLPKLFFREGLLYLNNSRENLLLKLGIFHPHHIHSDLFPRSNSNNSQRSDCCFSFSRFIDLSPSEITNIFLCGHVIRWLAAFQTWKSAYRIHHEHTWSDIKSKTMCRRGLVLSPIRPIFSLANDTSALYPLCFTKYAKNVCGFTDQLLYPLELRSTKLLKIDSDDIDCSNIFGESRVLDCLLSAFPAFLTDVSVKVIASPLSVYSPDASAKWWLLRQQFCGSPEAFRVVRYGSHTNTHDNAQQLASAFRFPERGGLADIRPENGWSRIVIPAKETLVTDSGKLTVLDTLLNRLKAGGHRVLIYSQMTRMIDLLEEYMWHRKHKYMRLDGSSKISDRRDMVADFQTKSDIFVFLLSTRAGGLGINLTAADTVIFYDSDWNPTVDQQAMDRAHRLGQTKQVTVYRLVCKGSIEERILQRAQEKSEIQRMVISGGTFKPDALKPKEVVSLLLDDDELERKFFLRQEERKDLEKSNHDRKKKSESFGESKRGGKRKRREENVTIAAPYVSGSNQDADSVLSIDSVPPSPYSEHSLSNLAIMQEDNSSDGPLVVDDSSPSSTPVPFNMSLLDGDPSKSLSVGQLPQLKKRGTGRGRGRPRGSGKRGNGRGRGNTLATAAAELAGAQAGKSAAFAAYGYSLTGNNNLQIGGTTTTAAAKPPTTTLSRRGRGGIRGASSLASRALSGRGRGSSRGSAKSVPPAKTISMGFYLPNS